MAEQDLRNTSFYKALLQTAKEQGVITLLDIVSEMKKHKDAPSDLDAVVDALKEDGIQYTESEDSDPDFMDEPSEEDLEAFDDDFEDDDVTDEDDEPTDDELKDIEDEEDDEDDEDEEGKRSSDEDDEDEDEEDEEEEEENINEWKGTDDDSETSAERFIDISSFSESTSEHKGHQQARFDASQDDPIRLYLKEIGNENLLTGEQEVELAMQMEKGAKIVQSVIRESGILISFFSSVIDKMNSKIEEDTEETLSTEELKEFLSVQQELDAPILRKRQAELQELLDKGVSFKAEAARLLAQAEADMYAPLRSELDALLAKLGRERGYAFILNADGNALPFVNMAYGEDITETVINLFDK